MSVRAKGVACFSPLQDILSSGITIDFSFKINYPQAPFLKLRNGISFFVSNFHPFVC